MLFRSVAEGTGNIMLRARAGTAKTTTVLEAIKIIPATKSILYLAFNKHIAGDVKRKVSLPNLTIKTFHGLGYSALIKAKPGIQLDDRKSYKHLIPELNLNPAEKNVYTRFIMRLLSCGKNAGVGKLVNDAEEVWDDLIDRFDLEMEAKSDRKSVV